MANVTPMRHQRQLSSSNTGLVNPLFALPASPPSQHRLNAALFSSNPPQYLIQAQQLQQQQQQQPSRPSPRRPLNLLSFEGVELVHHNANRELHQAEKLAASNAFQFDTITPKKPVNEEENNDAAAATAADEKPQTLASSSDDSGGFKSPRRGANRVKRATVVGNPMFANTPDSEVAPGESLGLDDLDMDYEQIMHYFDNLKVSKRFILDVRFDI